MRERRENVREPAMQEPRPENEGEEVPQVPGQRFPAVQEDHDDADCPPTTHGRPLPSEDSHALKDVERA